MIEITEVDNHTSLLLAMNRSPDHETGRCKQYRLVYPLHVALHMKNVMTFIKHHFVAMIERIGTAEQLVVLVTVNKRDFHYLFRQ